MAIPAKAVTVDKLFRAHCHLVGCTWQGTAWPAFDYASRERQGHLDWHREQEAQAQP